jgi:hypothetical protein
MKICDHLAATFACVLLVTGCAQTPDPSLDVSIVEPDFSQFAGDTSNPGVHTFLEQRCATLDCHGQVGRAFRLYSAGGLRLPGDGGAYPGSSPDTPEEIAANYEALVGLQPEQTSLVVTGSAPPTSLLICAKPLALQTHKGGQVLAPNGSGEACLESWLVGQIDEPSCAAAAQVP